MPEAFPQLHALVVADDPVAAGMLALDLVQAGVTAQAVASDEALLAQLRALEADASRVPAVLLNYDTLAQASGLSRRLISAGIRCHVVVAARDEEHAAAEQEAVLLDWLAVVRQPVDVEVVARHLGTARPFAAPPSATRVESGSLREDDLGEVIRALVEDDPRPRQEINAVIQLKSKGRSGSIAVLGGELVHAQTPEEQGRHALERMFCWREGTWRVVPGRHAGPHSLRGGLMGHIAAAREYARRVHESRTSLPYLDVPCTVRWERVRPLPAVAESMFRRIAVGMVLGDALDGDGDDELEAFAALYSRIKRGAVGPRDGVVDLPAKLPGSRRRSQPIVVPTGRPMVQPDTDAAHRHAATASYWAPGDLPDGEPLPDDLPDGEHHERDKTPLNPILPLSLPEYDPESGPQPAEDLRREAALRALESLPNRRNTLSSGWFGINVARDDEAVTADLSAVGRAVVEAAPAQPEETQEVSHAAAELAHTPAPRTESEAHFAEWSDGFEERLDQEASVIEQLRQPGEGAGRRTLLWMLAALLVTAVLMLVLMPGSPLYDNPLRAPPPQEPPVLMIYRQAVALIDADRTEEARLKLRGVCGQPGVPPEACLQLAVLEIEGGMGELARSHLERYLDDPGAAHRDKAGALYAHVFGPRPRPGSAP